MKAKRCGCILLLNCLAAIIVSDIVPMNPCQPDLFDTKQNILSVQS